MNTQKIFGPFKIRNFILLIQKRKVCSNCPYYRKIPQSQILMRNSILKTTGEPFCYQTFPFLRHPNAFYLIHTNHRFMHQRTPFSLTKDTINTTEHETDQCGYSKESSIKTNQTLREEIFEDLKDDTSEENPGTVGRCMVELIHAMENHRLPESENYAMLMIAQAVGYPTLEGIEEDFPITSHQWQQIKQSYMLRRRKMPIQYILGEWDFRDLTLLMKPPVFIPRPETEELVELMIKNDRIRSAKHFLEIGPGSGAICLSLLKTFPQLQGIAVDIGQEACELTRENALKTGVSDRLKIHQLDFTKENIELAGQQFDFIVSNPPYIPSKEYKNLQAEITRHEDYRALLGGEDGLDVVRSILQMAPLLLRHGGDLYMEVDSSHPEKIAQLVHNSGSSNCSRLELLNIHEDFNKLPRFVQLICNRKTVP